MKGHPPPALLIALRDGSDDDVTRSHVETCDRCSRLIAGLSSRTQRPGALPEISVSPGLGGRLQELTPDDAPQPGELWRAEWMGLSELVAVHGTEHDEVEVAAVAWASPEGQEDFRTPTDPKHGMASWLVVAHRRHQLPRYAFERQLGLLAADAVSVPFDQAPWPLEMASNRVTRIAELCRGQGDASRQSTLGALLDERGVARDDLVELGLSARTASLLLQNRAFPKLGEIELLADALGLDRREIISRLPSAPFGLLRELHEPQARLAVHERSRRENALPAAVKESAMVELARMGRRSSQRGEVDWKAEVARYFAS